MSTEPAVPGAVDLAVAIMAGGKSSRMGTDKSFVELGGLPLIEHLRRRIAQVGAQTTILIANRPEDYVRLDLPTYRDVLPDKGALGGIYTALHYSPSRYTLVLACDMPFVNPALLRHMIALAEGDTFDVIAPRVEGHPQGFHAIYSRACLGPIRACLDADRLKVIGFHRDVRVRYLDEDEYRPLDPEGRSFFNVNTPEELAEARRLIAPSAPGGSPDSQGQQD